VGCGKSQLSCSCYYIIKRLTSFLIEAMACRRLVCLFEKDIFVVRGVVSEQSLSCDGVYPSSSVDVVRFLILSGIQVDEEEEADDDEMVEEHEADCLMKDESTV
jgi:hypothetical protein